jgi:menaquinol-cytochrome c reductase cytochrome b/c subunit
MTVTPSRPTRRPTESFARSSGKTYTLVELVHGAPPQMIDHGPEDTVFAFPVVALIELLLSLGVTVVLLLMSLALNAPLEAIANPNQTTDPAKAPWYFMGLQEMLEHGHPTLMAVIIPTVLVLFVLAIPYLDNSRAGAGCWFTSARGKRITALAALYTLVVMPAFIVLDNRFPPRELLRGMVPDLVAQALIPAAVLAVIVLVPVIILRRFRPDAREVLLLLFTILFVSAVIFTVTGFLFRGPGFKLYWPWNMPGGYNPFHHL